MGLLISISLNNKSAYCCVFRSSKASKNLHMDCPVMALNSIIAPQILLGSIMRSSHIESLFFIRYRSLDQRTCFALVHLLVEISLTSHARVYDKMTCEKWPRSPRIITSAQSTLVACGPLRENSCLILISSIQPQAVQLSDLPLPLLISWVTNKLYSNFDTKFQH